MLQDSRFRKTARCSYYKNFLASKSIAEFPIQRVSPEALNVKSLIHATGFNKPFVITESNGDTSSSKVDTGKLGLVLPDRDKDLLFVSKIVGNHTPVKIIEVGQQAEITEWTLGEYAQYLKDYRSEDHKVLNMITLEFSGTPFNSRVQAPHFVRALDWIDSIWPLDRRARGDYPKVQKYCLAGMAGSYTDFHIDFGGTSVWYHVLKGQKRFYLVPPTTANLRAFEKWTTSSAQSDVFFGDLLGPTPQCFQFDLNPGETFIIPSGWIHAVYTPLDSLVFGGNFVHSYSILRQLQIYSIEHRTRVQKAYRFPFFRQINWYFLCTVLPAAQKMYTQQNQQKQKQNDEPQQSWVTMLQDSDDEDEDEEDSYDDLQQVAATLRDPTVLFQLPYLVKTCEIWHAAGEDRQEKNVFDYGLSDSGCVSVGEVFNAWWTLLLLVAEKLPREVPSAGAGANSATDSTASCRVHATRDEAIAHIQLIKDLPELDLLNDQVVRPVFSAFEAELTRALRAVSPVTTPAAISVVSEAAKVEELQSDNDVEAAQVSVAYKEPPSEPLKLKFTLKKAVPSQSDATVTRAAPASAFPTTAPAALTSAPKAVVSKKEKALKLTFGIPKAKVAVNHNVERSTAKSAGRYGTRGLKLSADFLSRAMDVDVGAEDAYDDDDDDERDEEGSASDAAEGHSGDDSSDGGEERKSASERASSSRSHSRKRARSEFVFQDRDAGAGGAEDGDWEHSRRGRGRGAADAPSDPEDHDVDSDATEMLSDVEGGTAGNRKRKHSAQATGSTAAGGTTARPAYYVDRLSEAAQMRQRQQQQQGQGQGPVGRGAAVSAAAAGVAGITSVPQVQGVRSALSGGPKSRSVPANNRLKIMKKLGLKL